MKKNRYIYIFAFLLFFGGISYLTYSGLSEGSVYFLNVSEALAAPNDEVKSARLFGTVAPDGLVHADSGLGVQFLLADEKDASQTLRVDYQGVVPDTFQAGAEVIVEGTLENKSVFKANSLMTKCPSKYEKENRES